MERTHHPWAPCDPHAHQPRAPCDLVWQVLTLVVTRAAGPAVSLLSPITPPVVQAQLAALQMPLALALAAAQSRLQAKIVLGLGMASTASQQVRSALAAATASAASVAPPASAAVGKAWGGLTSIVASTQASVKAQQLLQGAFWAARASCIPHLASCIPYPVSRIPHPVSRIPHPASCIPHPASFTQVPSRRRGHPRYCGCIRCGARSPLLRQLPSPC